MRNHRPDHPVLEVHGTQVPPVPDAGRQQLRLGAKGLVTSGNRVLLVQERHADGSPFWTIPGGGIEPGESLSDCLRREIQEEVQTPSVVSCVVDSFVYRHTSRPTTTVYAVFDATLERAPEPNPAERIFDHAWRTPTDLPSATLDPIEHVIEASMSDSER